jgi:hypothetical protein
MTSSYKDNLENLYQLEEDAQGAGLTSVESQLIDFGTGVELVDASTQEQLTGETLETQVLLSRGDIRPVVVTNDEARPLTVNVTNREQSEVSTTLLGIPREETALALFDTVNIYGVNEKEWASGPSAASYQYSRDPAEWTFRENYGYYWRHLPAESALQAYVFPPPVSFTYLVDDNSGRFPGGQTNGSMTAFWESKRAFRYQPGRVTGFTLGVRMSTGSNYAGEVVEWGCRNGYGDGYFFRLERGTDLSIVRTSPDLGTLVAPREQWNGDKLLVNEGRTGWGLNLSRVTMFKIEFSWYGAVGAKFLAYVPDGHGEARWVVLHYISAENRFETPSLRSAYLRMFTSVRSTAGAQQPTFINLYGSSVYIDGGDKGTVTTGAATLEAPKNIDSNARSLLGLNFKAQINGVDNQKAIYPTSLSAYASVPTRIDLIFRGNSCAGVQYGYGAGTSISRSTSAVYSGSVTSPFVFTIASGQFPDISNELAPSSFPTYLTGRRVKINGTGVFATHATAINSGLTAITTDRPLPPSLSSISLSRLDAYAIGDTTITSGTTTGTIYRTDNAGYWRLGLWPQASGVYDGTQEVAWFASSYPRLSFNSTTGQPNGETRFPSAVGCNEASSFTIATGLTSTVSAGGNSVTVTGEPWPVAVVAELMDSATISNVVIAEGAFSTVGSGATKAVATFVVSGLSQSTTAAGGSDYIAHKFEDALADPLSACLVDRQGSYVMPTTNKVATYFLGADETKTFSLDNVFGPDKMFITGAPNTAFNTGALFVMATARAGSGIASAMLNWEEQ